MKNFKYVLLLLALVSGMTSGCGKSNSDSTSTEYDSDSDSESNMAESSLSEAGSQATAAEGGSLTLMNEITSDYVDPEDENYAPMAACSILNRSCGSSAIATIDWDSCTIGSSITMTGGWTETFATTSGSSETCINATATAALKSGYKVTRKTQSSGVTATFSSGATLVTDTNGGDAWDGTSIPATGVEVSRTSATAKTIQINGTRKILRGPAGRKIFDVYITGTINTSGTRSGQDRVMTGSSKVYHNLAKYNATHTYNNVTWANSSCCYPTSGSISSVFTGGGTTTLAFSSTCGTATFTSRDGASSSLSLTKCQ